jgi:hypothetical protein
MGIIGAVPDRRIALIHWNAPEARERISHLRLAGFDAQHAMLESGAGLRQLAENPPCAVVIDLSRKPSHGSACAVVLRQQKRTRHTPIVFTGGAAEKVARVRELLPDAVYSDWNRIEEDLRSALAHPPAQPLVPGTMDAYSGTPLVKKLGIKAGSRVALLGAPRGFENRLEGMPEGVRLQTRAAGEPELILLFVRSQADLDHRLPRARRALGEGGGIWIVWPKKTATSASDLNQRIVRSTGLAEGLVDYKICAVDDTWSGLLFTQRRPKGQSKPRR